MNKRVFIQLPSEVRIPRDCDFRPNRMQIASAARRAMGDEIPMPRKNERQQKALLVAVVCFVIVAYGAFLLWVSK